MSYEPVAKRTRLGISRSQIECKIESDIERMQRELIELYGTMMSNCDEIVEVVPEMNRAINALKNPQIECQIRAVQSFAENVVGDMIYARKGLCNIEQIVYDMSLEKLHLDDCTESEECLLRMQRELARDHFILECKREIRSENGLMSSNVNLRQSPLHHAVIKRHVKCVKFLLERGANVNSLTTIQENTILHSLYSVFTEEEKRLEILKLLLKYGVASIFEQNKAGGYALRMSSLMDSMNEVTLLLQYGATMTREETQNVIIETWKMCNLQMLKIILLECCNNLNLNAFAYDFCRQLINVSYHKMILQGVPADECHEKLLEALKFYKAFGGKFCVYPWDIPNQGLMQYLKKYKHRKYFKGAKSRIKALISNPMSLKEISRLAVSKCIRKDYHANIKKLEVPEDMQPFLRFDDVTITERPEKFVALDNEDTSSSGDSSDDSDMELLKSNVQSLGPKNMSALPNMGKVGGPGSKSMACFFLFSSNQPDTATTNSTRTIAASAMT
ncbi:hypothetical protein B566_EDAN015084 [Ephemera danica]|nr:hypothetical protein B566_EDAN015084 [Ephemera danica]